MNKGTSLCVTVLALYAAMNLSSPEVYSQTKSRYRLETIADHESGLDPKMSKKILALGRHVNNQDTVSSANVRYACDFSEGFDVTTAIFSASDTQYTVTVMSEDKSKKTHTLDRLSIEIRPTGYFDNDKAIIVASDGLAGCTYGLGNRAYLVKKLNLPKNYGATSEFIAFRPAKKKSSVKDITIHKIETEFRNRFYDAVSTLMKLYEKNRH